MLVAGTKGVLNNLEKDGRIDAMANEVERILTEWFPGDEETIKQMFVEKVLYPLAVKLKGDGK